MDRIRIVPMARMQGYWPRWVLLLLLVAVSPKAHTQVLIALILGDDLNSGKIEFGLTTGLNASTLDGVPGGEPARAPYLGLYFDIKLSENWYFHPETWPKSVLGEAKLKPYATGDPALDVQLADATVRRRIDCIPTSFMITRKLGQHVFIDAGPYGNLILGGRDVFTRESADDELSYTQKIGDQLHRVELGAGIGARYKLSKGLGMNFGVHYFAGLTGVDKADQWKFQWLRASVGIPIGRGKAKKAAETKPAE
ncbi:MAG: PorT family protein [Flavobacteriales bacterium]|nr:PorT family protein [Flavobacteriales bacterium]